MDHLAGSDPVLRISSSTAWSRPPRWPGGRENLRAPAASRAARPARRRAASRPRPGASAARRWPRRAPAVPTASPEKRRPAARRPAAAAGTQPALALGPAGPAGRARRARRRSRRRRRRACTAPRTRRPRGSTPRARLRLGPNCAPAPALTAWSIRPALPRPAPPWPSWRCARRSPRRRGRPPTS
eukprot:scaffold2930_cov105-Isochrysis_galbana.AAC.7